RPGRSQPLRRAVRGISRRDLWLGGRHRATASPGPRSARLPPPRQPRVPRLDHPPVQACGTRVREGAVSGATPYAIRAVDLGVRYNLRFTRKTTVRTSVASFVLRRPPQRFWALRHVSIELSHGESLAVIGPNGA